MKTILTVLLFLFSFPVGAWDSNPYAVESAVYKIEIVNGGRMGIGTGVLVAWDKILTNCHIMKKSPGWPVVVNRKTGNRFPVLKYYNLGDYDACVLVGSFEGQPVPLTDQFAVGQDVWHYGYPHGISGMGQGVIKGLIQSDSGTVIESASFCNPGSSGGPLLDVKGRLVGLNFGVRTKVRDQCLSIPAADLMPYLR